MWQVIQVCGHNLEACGQSLQACGSFSEALLIVLKCAASVLRDATRLLQLCPQSWDVWCIVEVGI